MNWHDLYLIIVTIIVTRSHMWLKTYLQRRRDEKAMPYSWTCEDCSDDTGSVFKVRSVDVTSLDNMILTHKSAWHGWNHV